MKDRKEKQAGITALSTHTAGDGGAQRRLAGTRFAMTACSVKGDTRWQA